MIDDIGQKRSYHNNRSPHNHQKRTTANFKCKNYTSETNMIEEKQANQNLSQHWIIFHSCKEA